MSGRTQSWAVTLLGALGMMIVPGAIVVGVVVGASAPDRPRDSPALVSPIDDDAPADPALPSQSGRATVVDPLAAHQTMLEQMRVNVTPQMVQRMNADPLTHSSGDLAEAERHAAELDRMLARKP